MSGSRKNIPPPPAPVWLPALRAGEIDGRYVNCTADPGCFGDYFPSINDITLTITRQDNRPITSADLQPAGVAWPDTLDITNLIPTFGLMAPAGAAGVTYVLTMTVNPTAQGRLFIRDLLMEVVSRLG